MKLILALFNFLLGVVSILPCLMAGLMVFDSPGSIDDPLTNIVSILLLSFPIVCFICVIIPQYIVTGSIFISLFPIVEAAVFLFSVYLISILNSK